MNDDGLDLLGGICLLFGGWIQVLAVLWHGSAVVAGDLGAVIGLVSYLLWSYIFLVMGSFQVNSNRRDGETGARYLTRVAVWPYAAALGLLVEGVRATPWAARSVVQWLTTPKDSDEVSEE